MINQKKKKRALFLDRDGVLNHLKLENGNLYSPHRIEEFKLLPKVGAAVKKAKALGLLTIMVTNQPDIERGKMTLRDLKDIHTFLLKKVPIDDIFICLHDNRHQCNCRKPNNELIKKAAKKWGIDLEKSFFVGDRWKDVYAGHSSGCKTILIPSTQSDDKEFWAKSKIKYDWTAKNLFEAVKKIEKLMKEAHYAKSN